MSTYVYSFLINSDQHYLLTNLFRRGSISPVHARWVATWRPTCSSTPPSIRLCFTGVESMQPRVYCDYKSWRSSRASRLWFPSLRLSVSRIARFRYASTSITDVLPTLSSRSPGDGMSWLPFAACIKSKSCISTSARLIDARMMSAVHSRQCFHLACWRCRRMTIKSNKSWGEKHMSVNERHACWIALSFYTIRTRKEKCEYVEENVYKTASDDPVQDCDSLTGMQEILSRQGLKISGGSKVDRARRRICFTLYFVLLLWRTLGFRSINKERIRMEHVKRDLTYGVGWIQDESWDKIPGYLMGSLGSHVHTNFAMSYITKSHSSDAWFSCSNMNWTSIQLYSCSVHDLPDWLPQKLPDLKWRSSRNRGNSLPCTDHLLLYIYLHHFRYGN